MYKYRDKKPVLFILIFAGIVLLIFLLMQPVQVRYAGDLSMLVPKGKIALKERNLLFLIQGVMLVVVIPVYVLTFIFSWKYREHNTKAKYTPDWEDNKVAEFIWWGVPFIIVVIMGTVTVIKTYKLDPFKPLASEQNALKIQVVALQWKWLFIYPEEKIASVNFFQFPEKRPLHFEITADAPMNSLWIPKLGGQIYAMPRMRSQLHLIAEEVGEYPGSSANISGEGFAGMHFIAKASSVEDYKEWVEKARQSSHSLTHDEYEQLAKPSSYNPVVIYQLQEENLFDQVIMKYMHPDETKVALPQKE